MTILGIDKAIFYTLITRGWNIFSGLLTIAFITKYLTPELQGYYYTFNSLIALQIFAELGLSYAIIQIASHEKAKLRWNADGTLSGDPEIKGRLQSLLKFTLVWYSLAALILISFLLPAGIYFFNAELQYKDSNLNFSTSWSWLVVFTSANLFISGASAIIEGCGKVAQIAKLRLLQSIFAIPAGWLVLSQGGGLYALTVSSLMMAIVGLGWLFINYRLFFSDIYTHKTNSPGMSWGKEIWPFQWRIAISWMSGYLIFQIFSPMLFSAHGPIVAGQMGMSLQIFGALNAAAIAWISTKAPTFGILIANKEWSELDTLFMRALKQSLLILIFCVIALIISLYILNKTHSPYLSRILPLPLFASLGIVCVANHIVLAEAAYLRSHKLDPFMPLSVGNGLLTLALAILLIKPYGLLGAVGAYALPNLTIALIGGSFVFMRFRKSYRKL